MTVTVIYCKCCCVTDPVHQLASGAAEGARGGFEEEKEADAAPTGSLQAVAEEQAAAEGAARQARVSFLQHSMATVGLQRRALTCPHHQHSRLLCS